MLIRWKMVERGQPVDDPTNESYHPFPQIKPLFSVPPFYYGVEPDFISGYSSGEINQARLVLEYFNDSQQMLHPDGAALSLEEINQLNRDIRSSARLLGENPYSKAMEIDCNVRDNKNLSKELANLKLQGIIAEVENDDFVIAANEALPTIKEQRAADVDTAYNKIKNTAPIALDFEAKADMLISQSNNIQAIQNFQFSGDDAARVIEELNEFRSRPFNF